MKELSDRIMDAIADGLSAKTCFVIFCIIAVVPLFFQMPHDILSWQQWLSQTVIQLVALNVLAVVSKKESREQQNLLKETHDIAMAEVITMREDLSLAKEERDELKKLVAEIHKNMKGSNSIGL